MEIDDPARDDRLHGQVAGNPEVLLVAGVGGRYSTEVIEALCRVHRQPHGDTGFVWVFAIMPFNFESRDKRAAENLARVTATATKVITFDNNTFRQSKARPQDDAFAIVD